MSASNNFLTNAAIWTSVEETLYRSAHTQSGKHSIKDITFNNECATDSTPTIHPTPATTDDCSHAAPPSSADAPWHHMQMLIASPKMCIMRLAKRSLAGLVSYSFGNNDDAARWFSSRQRCWSLCSSIPCRADFTGLYGWSLDPSIGLFWAFLVKWPFRLYWEHAESVCAWNCRIFVIFDHLWKKPFILAVGACW